MTRITITEGGREVVVTDIAPHRAERDEVLAQLKAIYAEFSSGPVDALDAQEASIVELVNRFNELDYIIETFGAADARRANIMAGWSIVKAHCGEGDAR